MITRLFSEETQAELLHLSDIAKSRLGAWFLRPDEVGQFTIYDGYPYLFESIFPKIKSEELRDLALAGRFFAQGSILFDRALDGTQDSNGANIIRGQMLLVEGYNVLIGLFPNNSPFWSNFHELFREYLGACEDELSFREGRTPWSEFTLDRGIQIAQGKTALAQATIQGLSCLYGLGGPETNLLVASVREYYIGRQIWDDVCDWKEDLLTGTPSLPLVFLLPNGPSGQPTEEQGG